MKLGEHVIAESGLAPFFRVANAEEVGVSVPELRRGDALRTWVPALSGFQKEALVSSALTGLTWRLVSDEGDYLNGHDAAPCPLAFLTVGMVSSYMNEIRALAAARKMPIRRLRLTQDNFYTMKGSMKKGTMTEGALPVELQVEIDCDGPEEAVQGLLADALHASPLNGLMRGCLPSLFTLSRNGQEIPTGEARPLQAPVISPPAAEFMPHPAGDDLALVERLGRTPRKDVTGGTATPASSLNDEQDRTLNIGAICTLREDGLKEIEQHTYSPHGSVFRFLSEEAPANGGEGRAPDANSYISAGIGFCIMTQFGRMASMEQLDLPNYAIMQDTHFSLGGASGGTGRPGEVDPGETHVHLTTAESDDVARAMLDVSERTCFLHALCRTDLRTKLRMTRRID